MQQAPAPDIAKPASTPAPAGTLYLQVGSFREQKRPAELRIRLLEQGFKCEIQEVSVDGTDVYHRVRVGPSSDPEVLEKSRQKLGASGMESRTVTDRE